MHCVHLTFIGTIPYLSMIFIYPLLHFYLPSAKLRYPSQWSAVWCTKTSELPSSGQMNPKPLLVLNHLQVPVAFVIVYKSYSFIYPGEVLKTLRVYNTRGNNKWSRQTSFLFSHSSWTNELKQHQSVARNLFNAGKVRTYK